MRIEYVTRAKAPSNLAADVELHFDDGVLAGLKVVGFSLWRTPTGLVVTLPARTSSNLRHELIRSQEGMIAPIRKLKAHIVADFVERERLKARLAESMR